MPDAANDGFQGLPPVAPLAADAKPGRRAELFATLARIDGWGRGAWDEVVSAWRLRGCVLALEHLGEHRDPTSDYDDRVNAFVLIADGALPRAAATDQAAVCDWVLRRAWSRLLAAPLVDATSFRPGESVVASNACFALRTGERPTLCLRLILRFPFAGMCCDGKRFARFVRTLESFAAELSPRREPAALAAHRRAVAVQRALRAALPSHGLVGFLGDGSRLARARSGGPAPGCRPLRAPPRARVTIDLGALGRHTGLGIRRGITAVCGAPYHGKSTLLAALAAGRSDHPPGDGRELVVADPSAVSLQAEDGRRIKEQDVSTFFPRLPGASARAFATDRASGATSMAASALQAIAAGCSLLLVDEDTAASNFLAIEPTMRALLGAPARGARTLVDVLPHLARRGVSAVLVAGSSSATLGPAETVLVMEHFQPREATARARRLLRARSFATAKAPASPKRRFADEPDCLLGPRHFFAVDASEPERPVIADTPLDLRRSGWELDPALARGACAAAAWCCRLAERGLDLAALRERWESFARARGPCGLDPFHSQLVALPPWQLIVSVLERLERPRLTSH